MNLLSQQALMMASSGSGPGLLFERVFTSAPAPGEYSIRQSNPTVQWVSSNQTLQISLGNLSNFVSWDAWGSVSGAVAIESDILFVSASGSLKHWGLYIDQGSTGQHGYRVFHLNSKWGMSQWDNGTEGTSADFGPGDVTTGQVYTVRLETNGAGSFTLKVNGTTIGTLTSTAFSTFRPGWFTYGNDATVIGVKAVRVYRL